MKPENKKREILDLLKSQPVAGMRRVELYRALGSMQKEYFRQLFRELLKEGKICKKRGGRYVPVGSCVTGVFHANARGFGFVAVEGQEEDIFISNDDTKGALSGDKVQVALSPVLSEKGPSGRIIRILEHERKDIVCFLADNGRGGYVLRPLRRDLPGTMPLHQNGPVPDLNGAKAGDWVLASYFPRTDERAPLELVIARRISKSGGVKGDLDAVCKEYGIPKKYAVAAEQNAAALQPIELPREDCRKLDTFTIDPVDAKDFDDAISFRKLKGGYAEIGVHIADVACYVTHNSPLDRAARRRGFTSYLPCRTIGMLPDTLSSDICSLKEGVDRLAHTVFLKVNAKSGEIVSSRRIHTIIRSDKRLNFDQVDRFMAGECPENIPDKIAKALDALVSLTAKMREHREKTECFLPFDSTETKVICAGKPPKVEAIVKVKAGPASQLIEELMLAANTCVAREVEEKGIHAFFRVHEGIAADSLFELSQLAWGILGKKYRLGSRENLIDFINDINGDSRCQALALQLLRMMPRAQYSLENTGHFGLGKDIYCHFTSPIRRYSDLSTHQQLIASDLQAEGVGLDKMRELEQAVNALEVNNDQAAFAIEDRLKLRKIEEDLRERRIGELECIVARALPAGLSLYIPDYGIMGFMPIENMNGRNWRFDSRRSCITDNRVRYGCGNTLYARAKTVDPVRNELLLFLPTTGIGYKGRR